MKKIIYIVVCLTFFSCNQRWVNIPENPLIAVYVQNNEKQNVILIGELKQDSIIEIDDYDSLKNVNIAERKPLLEKYSKFYFQGYNGEVTIKNIDSVQYQCTDIIVGNSDNYNLNIDNEFSIVTNFKPHHIKKFSNDYYLSDRKIQQIIYGKLSNAVEKHYKNVENHSVFADFDNKISVDLNNDGVEEIFFDGFSGDEYNRKSVIVVVNIKNDSVDVLGSIQSWYDFDSFIGITDIDNDGFYEIVYKKIGYESVGLCFYEYSNIGFEKIFETVLFGC
jgi:hypothetical protein